MAFVTKVKRLWIHWPLLFGFVMGRDKNLVRQWNINERESGNLPITGTNVTAGQLDCDYEAKKKTLLLLLLLFDFGEWTLCKKRVRYGRRFHRPRRSNSVICRGVALMLSTCRVTRWRVSGLECERNLRVGCKMHLATMKTLVDVRLRNLTFIQKCCIFRSFSN